MLQVVGAPVRVSKVKTRSKSLPQKGQQKKVMPYPRLADKKSQKELLKVFTPYMQVFNAAPRFTAYVAHLVQAYFNSPVVSKFGQTGAISLRNPDPAKAFNETITKSMNDSVTRTSLAPNLQVTKDSITLFTNPITLGMSIKIPAPSDLDARKKMDAFLKKIFPNYVTPYNYVYRPQELPPISFQFKNQPTTGWINLTNFERLDFPDNMGYHPDKISFLEADPSLTRTTISTMMVKVDVASLTSHNLMDVGIDSNEPTTGVLQSALDSATMEVSVQIQINFSMEQALWMMSQYYKEDFVPKAFYEFCCEHVDYLCGKTSEEPPVRTMMISDIHKVNMENKVKFGISDKPRTNSEGYIINRVGDILHVPDTNNIDKYIQAMRNGYNSETGDVTPSSKQADLKNIPIYSDWVNGYFTYTGSEGKVLTINLNGGVPLDDVTIGKHLDREPINFFGYADGSHPLHQPSSIGLDDRIFSVYDTMIGVAKARLGKDLFVAPQGALQYSIINLSGYWHRIKNMPGSMVDVLTNYKDTSLYNESQSEVIQGFLATCRNLFSVYDKIEHYGVATSSEMKIWLEMIVNYGAKSGKVYVTKYKQSFINNQNTPVSKLPDKVNLPNVASEGIFILPHQLDVDNQAKKTPDAMVLDIHPGGGKTFSVVVDILRLLEAGKIHRPLVACPGKIVAEWCTEINRVSKGKLNAIPLTRQVIRKMSRVMQSSREDFINYAKAAPPNTIFVAALNLFVSKRDIFSQKIPDGQIRYGSKRIFAYPQLWLAQSIGFDYIAIDECQVIKSTKSQVTNAIQQLTSLCKYKRLASGTLLKNRGDDLVGEFSSINPAIYGSLKEFYEKYGELEGKKFVGFKPGGEIELKKDGQVYTSWITKRRQDWSFLLPKINTQFYRTGLTENQQVFYTQLLNEAAEEIKKDSKLQKLLAEGDLDKEDEIAAKMKPYLAKIEIFINNPSTDRVPFKELSTTRDEDLISPKITLCEQIVYHHFNGGTFNKIPFIKEKSKVVIFVYNPEIVGHFRDHFKPKGQKVLFYTAGNDDVISQFKNDPSYTVLVAAEDSIKEGLNLQVASRLIRTQVLWSPGNQEQSLSRVMRPDVTNKYDRKEINYDIIITSSTMEIAKTARLISKIFTNMKVSEGDNPQFQSMIKAKGLTEYPLVTMSLDAIKDYQIMDNERLQGLTDEDPLAQYYSLYGHIIDYEKIEFERKKDVLRRMVAEKLGIPPEKVTDTQLINGAFTPVKSNTMLPGSKSIWVPVQNGATPHDPYGLGLVALSGIKKENIDEDGINEEDESDSESDNEDEGEDGEDNVTYAVGDLVQTEFGMGHISSILKRQVRVDIPGLPFSPVTLPKSVVFKPTNEEAVTKVLKIMKANKNKGILFMNGMDGIPNNDNVKVKVSKPEKPSIKVGAPTKPPPKVIHSDEPEIKDDQQQEKTVRVRKGDLPPNTKSVVIESGIFDGMPCIYMFTDEPHAERVMKTVPANWKTYNEFVYKEIGTYQGLKNLIAKVEDTFVPYNGTMERLMNAGTRLYRRGSPKLIQREPVEWNFGRFLNIINHKPPKDPNSIKIYPLLVDGVLYAVANLSTQRKQAMKFKNMKVVGVPLSGIHESVHIASFKNIRQAVKCLEELRKQFKIKNFNNAVAVLQTSQNNLKL